MIRRLNDACGSGFTLIECIVVIAIVALIAALALPAIQSSREAGRRAVCQNHLKQIGLALAGHHAAHGRYPAGMKPNARSDNALFAAHLPFTAHSAILPYLEQAVVYNAINFTNIEYNGIVVAYASALSPSNQTVLETPLQVFCCPSDGRGRRPGCNYRCSVGSQPYPMSPACCGGDGAFPGLHSKSASDFADGLSHVVGFSERNRGSGSPSGFDRSRDFWYSSHQHDAHFTNNDAASWICSGAPSNGLPAFRDSGRYWLAASYEDNRYNHVLSPNATTFDCSLNNPGGLGYFNGGACSARSHHPGGVNVLFMDGGVRFVRDSIALWVWRGLATRSGGETIGEF